MASRVRGLFTWRNAARATVAGAAIAGAGLYSVHRYINPPGSARRAPVTGSEINVRDLPNRESMIRRLRSGEKPGAEEEFDLLVIGGGSDTTTQHTQTEKQREKNKAHTRMAPSYRSNSCVSTILTMPWSLILISR